MLLEDLTLEEFTRIGNEEGMPNNEQLKLMWEARPVSEEYVEEYLRETFQHCKTIIDAGNCRMGCLERTREDEISDEEAKAMLDTGSSKADAVREWSRAHHEDSVAIIKGAADLLAHYATTIQEHFPPISLCPDYIFLGALQTAYLTGVLRGSDTLKLDEMSK